MIRKTWEDEKWLLTPQQDHARIAGVIAAGWSGERLKDEVSLAISRHDDGWKEADAAARITKAGTPMEFTDYPPMDAVKIWKQSATSLFEEGKFYAAQLVASHFSQLARSGIDLAKLGPRQAMAVGDFIGSQQALIMKCRKELQAGNNAAKRGIETRDVAPGLVQFVPVDQFHVDLRFLQVCDLISLLICGEFEGEQVIEDVPHLAEGNTLTVTRESAHTLDIVLHPLPFKKKLREHISGYVVPKRVYESDDDLRSEIASIKLAISEFTIHPKGKR